MNSTERSLTPHVVMETQIQSFRDTSSHHVPQVALKRPGAQGSNAELQRKHKVLKTSVRSMGSGCSSVASLKLCSSVFTHEEHGQDPQGQKQDQSQSPVLHRHSWKPPWATAERPCHALFPWVSSAQKRGGLLGCRASWMEGGKADECTLPVSSASLSSMLGGQGARKTGGQEARRLSSFPFQGAHMEQWWTRWRSCSVSH